MRASLCGNRPVGETNVEIARRGYQAVLSGDLDRVRQFLHPYVKWHGGDPSAPLTTFREGKAIEMVHYPNVEDALAAAGL
jgi:ketosteroid isomerase-like protein